MTPDILQAAIDQVVGGQPHPQAPGVTVNDYPIYERVAGMLNSTVLRGNNPKPEMVEHAYHTLKGAEMSPSEFEHIWTAARPIANRLLNRDPSIPEMAGHLRQMTPGQMHGYYSDHPYPGYEEVKAGDVARYMRAAEPIARANGHTPNLHEVTRFAVAGYEAEDMQRHYGGS